MKVNAFGKTVFKRFVSILMLTCMLMCIVPLEAYAILGAEERQDGLNGQAQVRIGSYNEKGKTFYYLENDYIRFDVLATKNVPNSSVTYMTTQPTRTKKSAHDLIYTDKTYQELFFDVDDKKRVGCSLKEVSVATEDIPFKDEWGNDDYDGKTDPAIALKYEFDNYIADVRLFLVKLDKGEESGSTVNGTLAKDTDDEGRTWGIRALAVIKYKKTPGSWYVQNNVKMHLNMVGFSKMGHSTTETPATVYMSTATGSIDDGFTHKLTALPVDIKDQNTNVATFAKRNVTSSEAITELNTRGYLWANSFAATSGLYREYVEGHGYYDYFDDNGYSSGYLPSMFSATKTGDVDLVADYATLMGVERSKYTTSMLWGMRNLYAKNEPDFTPSDKVTVKQSAKHLGIYKDGNGFKTVVANNEYELKNNTKKYGEPVAKLRGEFKEDNDRYIFTSGVAALSESVTAVWRGNGNGISVGKDGSIMVSHISLNCPSFKFYSEKSNTPESALTLKVCADGIKAEMNPSYNNADISVDIPNTETELSSVLIKPDGGLNFDGTVEFQLFPGTDFSIEELSYELDSKKKFKLNGIRAKGSVDTAEMMGLEMAKLEGTIDTITPCYSFTMELNVYDIFEANADLEIKRLKNSGALAPNKIDFDVNTELGKIPLISPVVVAHISGGGGGFDNLVDTINGDFFAIPPIKLIVTGAGDVFNTIEGKAKYTFGPAYFKYEATDLEIKFLKIKDLIDKFVIYEGVQGETRSYGGKNYTGLAAIGGSEIAISVPGGEKAFITAGGNFNASAFAGLDNYKKPTKIYVVADINGGVKGTLKVPDNIDVIGGLELFETDFEFCLGASTNISVNGGLENALTSTYKNFKVYAGVKKDSNWGLVKFRVWYIFPKNELSFKAVAGWNDLPSWNWQEKLTSGYTGMGVNDTEDVEVMTAVSLDEVKTSVDKNLVTGITSNYTHSVTAEEAKSADTTVLIKVTPKDNTVDIEKFAKSISVSKGGDNVNIKFPEYNINGEITNETEINAIYGGNTGENKCVLIGLGDGAAIGDTWDVSSTSYDFDVELGASAPLDKLNVNLNNYKITGSVSNSEADAEYVLTTYFGSESGEGETLIEQKDIADPSNISVDIPKEGTTMATGEYYVIAKLLRKDKVTIEEDGMQTEEDVLLPIDSVAFGKVSYRNTLQPDAPTSVSITSTGNEVLRSEWSEVTGANGYRIKIYQKQEDGSFKDTQKGYAYDTEDVSAGKIKGITYDDAAKKFTMDMALTVGGENIDQDGNKITSEDSTEESVLQAGKEYKISVSAYNYLKDEDNAKIENSRIYSEEKESNEAELPEYTPIEITGIDVLDMAPNRRSSATFDEETRMWRCSASAYPYIINGASETWEISVDTSKKQNTQCKISTVGENSHYLEEGYRDVNYYYLLNHSSIEGSVTLKIDIEEDKGTYKDVTTQYLIIDKDNVAPVLSLDKDMVFADAETGEFKIEGLSEAGAKVSIVGNDSSEDIVVGEDGRFIYTGNAFEIKQQKYDENGAVFDDDDNPVYETVKNPNPGGLITLYAKDDAGNESEKSTVIMTVGEDPYPDFNDEPVDDGDDNDDSNKDDEGDSGDDSGNGTGFFDGGGGTTRYTVKFNTDGGTVISSQRVIKNQSMTEPPIPTKDGYVFEGWYTDKECTKKYDFSTKVTESFTLYAKWNESVDSYVWENPFADVNEGDWYFENVCYVHQNGLMNGTSAESFSPNDTLTRGMLVTILYRAAGEPPVNKSVPFKDVRGDSYYANAVIWAQQNGIVNGVNEVEFAPEENITREQMAAIMYRYAKYMGYGTVAGDSTNILSYTDFGEVSGYAIEAMQYAVGCGLIKGKTETTLNPKDTATRAETATILNRFIEKNK